MKKAERLDIIECRGTPYEIGRQWGEGCREHLRASVDGLYAGIAQGPFRAEKEAVRSAAGRFTPAIRNFDPYTYEVLRGQAEGSGLSIDDALALQCSLELAFNYGGIAGLCTSFALSGRATRGGVTLLGQNIDWHPSATLDLLRIHHGSGIRELVLCLSGNPYYHLTSAGIGNCANLSLGPLDGMTRQVPVSVYLSRAMRQPKIGFALGVLRRQARGLAYLHLADASGGMAGIEAVNDDVHLLTPERDRLIHANHYETERFKDGDWTPQLIPDTQARAGRMRQLVQELEGHITPEAMMAVLGDHEGFPNSVCRHVDPSKPPQLASATKASLVMVPAEGLLYLAAGPPCEYGFLEYRV